ncbi:MAG: hypothetical protein ACE37F_01985 [Nannocystaceae bacterium]|nr:hypothetical protein [bacterium]
MSLVACPACNEYVLAHEPSCPHCGSHVRNERGIVTKTATAVLMGFALTACPAEDDGNDDTGASATMSDGSTSSDPTTGAPGSTSDDPGPASTGYSPDYGVPGTTGFGTTGIGEPEYGVPSTGEFTSSTSGEGSTGGSSTGIGGEPDYGVPETSGE